MRILPGTFAYRHELVVVVVRTDHSDDLAWGETLRALTEPLPDDPDNELMDAFVVDDPGWGGATVDDVLAIVGDLLPVVFIADLVTMHLPEHPLLAVTTTKPTDTNYAARTAFGREFRTLPGPVHDIHANLELSTMNFEEFCGDAAKEEDLIFRRFRS